VVDLRAPPTQAKQLVTKPRRPKPNASMRIYSARLDRTRSEFGPSKRSDGKRRQRLQPDGQHSHHARVGQSSSTSNRMIRALTMDGDDFSDGSITTDDVFF
jgi:hypothetical protein